MSITEEHAIRICETISNGYGQGFPLCPDTGKMISWSAWLLQQIEAQPLPPVEEGVPSGDTYITKPVQAWRYTSLDNVPEWLGDIFDESTTGPFAMASGEGLSVGGLSIVRPGDWIIKDADGYFSRCDDQKFAENYRHALSGEAPSPSKERLEKLAGELADEVIALRDQSKTSRSNENAAFVDYRDLANTAGVALQLRALLETEGK